MAFYCPRCTKEVSSPSSVITIGIRDTCPACSADLHCCTACEFYDPSSHHECRESQAEYVRDKERGNRCDYFRATSKARSASSSSAAAAAAFDALFKK